MKLPANLTRWESALIGFSALIAFGSFAAYITDFSTLNAVFEFRAPKASPIGKVIHVTGSVRRQPGDATGFVDAKDGDIVHLGDAWATTPGSIAFIQLKGGDTLKLESKTMIRIPQLNRLDVITGTLTLEAHQNRHTIRTRDQVQIVTPGTSQTFRSEN